MWTLVFIIYVQFSIRFSLHFTSKYVHVCLWHWTLILTTNMFDLNVCCRSFLLWSTTRMCVLGQFMLLFWAVATTSKYFYYLSWSFNIIITHFTESTKDKSQQKHQIFSSNKLSYTAFFLVHFYPHALWNKLFIILSFKINNKRMTIKWKFYKYYPFDNFKKNFNIYHD